MPLHVPWGGMKRSQLAYLAAGASLLVVVAGWLLLRGSESRPSLLVRNDLASRAIVELCPGQSCGGPSSSFQPGATQRVYLRAATDRARPDALRVTVGTKLIGCLLVGRNSDTSRLTLDLSEASPAICA